MRHAGALWGDDCTDLLDGWWRAQGCGCCVGLALAVAFGERVEDGNVRQGYLRRGFAPAALPVGLPARLAVPPTTGLPARLPPGVGACELADGLTRDARGLPPLSVASLSLFDPPNFFCFLRDDSLPLASDRLGDPGRLRASGSPVFGRFKGVLLPFVEVPDGGFSVVSPALPLPFSAAAFSSSFLRSSSFKRSASESSESL